MSLILHIRRGTAFSIMHRLSARRCDFVQTVTTIAFGVMCSVSTSLSPSLFTAMIHLLFLGIAQKLGWYDLSKQKTKHLEAAKLYDALVQLLIAMANDTSDKPAVNINIPATFANTRDKTPSIPSDVVWLVGDIM